MTHPTPLGSDDGVVPGLVLWEAWREREPGRRWRDDLSTMEAMRLMNEVRCFGRVAFQLVGRPLRRADVMLLVEHGARIGLNMRLAPGVDALTRELMSDLRDAGLKRIELDSALHSPAVLLEEIAQARTLGLGVHVTTEVTPDLLDALVPQAESLARAGVHVWRLTFGLGSTFAGTELERALARIVACGESAPLQLEVAGAPQVQRLLAARAPAADAGAAAPAAAAPRVAAVPPEGHALLFVGADGALRPSAELPVALGNVREHDIVDVFRDARELCSLRDSDQLHGKCAACEFRFLCGGGSRARAFAATGDWLAPDPACGYLPDAAAS